MLKFSVAYGSAAVTFLVMDALWLSTMTGLLYRPVLGPILADQVRLVPAVVFYVLFLGGIVYFGIAPALAAERWTIALLNGALFGLLAYATYDLTNQATLELWTTKITIADMAWGAVVSGAASTAGYFAAQWIATRA
jgi:uncharacterized membrane protein